MWTCTLTWARAGVAESPSANIKPNSAPLFVIVICSLLCYAGTFRNPCPEDNPPTVASVAIAWPILLRLKDKGLRVAKPVSASKFVEQWPVR